MQSNGVLVDDLEKQKGLNIPIHVDAASGGFVAPFAYPDLKWAFDVPRVVSINTSGHKFGLVYPGLGWILWRDEKCLHKDLVFELRKHQLGLMTWPPTKCVWHRNLNWRPFNLNR